MNKVSYLQVHHNEHQHQPLKSEVQLCFMQVQCLAESVAFLNC